jgi:hypothetical protein
VVVRPFSELDSNLPLEAKELYSVDGLETKLIESEKNRKEQIYCDFQPVQDLE